MKKKQQRKCLIAAGVLAAFALWTGLVRCIDVRPIGPEGSAVGFAAVNQWFHALTGVHMKLYELTDWLSIIPLGIVAGFGILGLAQLLKRRSILKVDRSILLLGGFYIVVMALFVFFEIVVINYRPVLINGLLEASYPSSTTMLVLCVMPTALIQLKARIKVKGLKKVIAVTIILFDLFMVMGRLISGVHWLSDIVGGALLSAGLVLLYRAVSLPFLEAENKK